MPGEDGDFDVGAALADVSSGLGFGSSDTPDNSGADDVDLDDASAGAAGSSPAPADPGDGGAATPAAAPSAPDPLATPPGTWRKEAAAVWAKLDPVARQEVLKREQDIFQGLEGYKADAQMGRSLQQVLQPYQHIFQQLGINPVQQLAGLLNTHHALATGDPATKAQLMQRIIKDYGIDPNALRPAEDAPYVAPEVQNLQNLVQRLQSRLDGQDQQRFTAAQASAAKDVETFAANPANKYFDEVANDIAHLLSTKSAGSLQEAYEKAVWLNPVVRTKHLADLDKANKAAAETERLNRLKASKAAMSANVRASSKPGSGTAPLGTMDDTLKQTLADIQSRGS